MVQIIPAIIAKNPEDLKNKVALVKNATDVIQLDVMDGIFVANKTFGEPAEIAKISEINWEIHLMVSQSLEAVKAWAGVANVKRIIFHWESVQDEEKLKECLEITKKAGKEVGVALNPETSLTVLDKWLERLDLVLLMTVNPGAAGQMFLPGVIPKIKTLRQNWTNGKIEVDGGINLVTAKQALEAGANVLVAGAFIFNHSRPEERIKELANLNKN